MLLIFLYCFQWNKDTNINYWKYHAKTICYPYYIIAIVTSPSKRYSLGCTLFNVKVCNLQDPFMVQIAQFHSKLRKPKWTLLLGEVTIRVWFCLECSTINCHNFRYSYRGNDIPFLIFSEKPSTIVFKNLKMYSNSYFSNFTTFRVRHKFIL